MLFKVIKRILIVIGCLLALYIAFFIGMGIYFDSQPTKEDPQTEALSKIAWGGADFGMSLKEVQKIETFKDFIVDEDLLDDQVWLIYRCDNYDPEYHHDTLTHKLGLPNDQLQHIALKFGGAKRDELYEVEFKFTTAPKSYWDRVLLPDAEIFYNTFKSKYGEETRGEGLNLTYDEIWLRSREVAYWKIGTKEILIEFSLAEETGEIYLSITITNSKYPTTEYKAPPKKQKMSEELF